MNIGELRSLIKDLPDELPVHVNDVDLGKFSDARIGAFEYEGDKAAGDERAFVIMVGVDELTV